MTSSNRWEREFQEKRLIYTSKSPGSKIIAMRWNKCRCGQFDKECRAPGQGFPYLSHALQHEMGMRRLGMEAPGRVLVNHRLGIEEVIEQHLYRSIGD